MAVAYKQELAPKGGYPAIEIARNLPRRGPSGAVMLLAGFAVMAGGFAFVIRGNRRRCEIRKEKLEARIALLPLLQAESDRRVLKAMKENEQLEAQIMKDVPGWKVGESVYNTKKWVTPMPDQLKKL